MIGFEGEFDRPPGKENKTKRKRKERERMIARTPFAYKGHWRDW